ncbi:hypothetical protein NMG60_11019244, partial [Bertholletia excelsa]
MGDYTNFIDRNKQSDLTNSLLNQIIEMHGFRKPSGGTAQKAEHLQRFYCLNLQKVLIDALNSINLMDPIRSTLNDAIISASAFITFQEAINDISDLNWQECCITSIQTLSSLNYDLVIQDAGASLQEPRRKKMRKRNLTELLAAANACGNLVGDKVEGSEPASSSSAITMGHGAMVVPRKK